MNIQPINFQTSKNPNFRATFPVMHWVAESNGSYAPASRELNNRLQGVLVRILNHSSKMTSSCGENLQKTFRQYVAKFDGDYAKNPIVRTYNDKRPNSFIRPRPVSYIISGNDYGLFEENISKDIGRSDSYEGRRSAKDRYARNGLDFVNNPSRRVKDLNSLAQVLHTKFEIVRNKLGKIKGYRLVDMRFLPESSYENPLDRYSKNLL